MLVNGLIAVSDTSGTKWIDKSCCLGDLLVGDFIKGERAFAIVESPASKLLCINSYANLSANSCTGSLLYFFLWRKAYRYPFVVYPSIGGHTMYVKSKLD